MRSADNEHPAGGEATEAFDAGGFVSFCVRQIEAAMQEAFRDLDRLSGAVLDADKVSAEVLQGLKSGQAAGSTIESLRSDLHRAGVHLQALDRLQQRISNACSNLSRAGTLMNSAELPIQKKEWEDFLREVRLAYTMEAERRMFDQHYDHAHAPTDDSPDQGLATDPMLF